MPSTINTLTPTLEDLKALFALQRAARWRLAETDAAARIAKLKRLQEVIDRRREEIYEAIQKDFGKHPNESELTEISPTMEELKHTIKHLPKWMRPKRVKTPLPIAGGSSRIRYEPKGMALILSPWNYPFYLAMAPFIAAVSAGCTVFMRSSEKVANIARLMHDIVAEVFEQSEAVVTLGGHETADALLEMPFDHFFFTGSPNIGRKVMTAAAKHLASVTLELGGKSPVVVDDTADIAKAAERITWGKFINAGQTCVAPDYVLAHERVQDELAERIQENIGKFYGNTDEAILACPSYASLVDARALKRLNEAVEASVNAGAKLVSGGKQQADTRRMTPTLLKNVPLDSALMADEIFGPVLPLLSYGADLSKAIEIIRANPKPLAMYIFSKDKANIERLLAHTSAGGTTVNNTILHLANPNMPFGGIGQSGQGHYHGWYGFEAFSHARSVYEQKLPTGVKMLYPPYGKGTSGMLKLLKLITG